MFKEQVNKLAQEYLLDVLHIEDTWAVVAVNSIFVVKLVDVDDFKVLRSMFPETLQINIDEEKFQQVNYSTFNKELLETELGLKASLFLNDPFEEGYAFLKNLRKLSEGDFYLKENSGEVLIEQIYIFAKAYPFFKRMLLSQGRTMSFSHLSVETISSAIVEDFSIEAISMAFNIGMKLEGKVGDLISTILDKVKERSTEVTQPTEFNYRGFETNNPDKYALRLNVLTFIIEDLRDLEVLASDLSNDQISEEPVTVVHHYSHNSCYEEKANQLLSQSIGYSKGVGFVNSHNLYFVQNPEATLKEVRSLYNLKVLNFVDANDIANFLSELG